MTELDMIAALGNTEGLGMGALAGAMPRLRSSRCPVNYSPHSD
ncbi:MAG: hypothetical protein JWM82_916 [Myxococcales bacterium]|nr:hypothetical protein [Myxococcales bacterium]